jgi:SAM-dependent methyltransferase
MIGRWGQLWRRLNEDTIGTDSYWWIALQNAAFYRDMQPLISRYARGRCLDAGAGRLAWRSLLTRHVDRYVSGDVVSMREGLDVLFDCTRGLPFADDSFDTVFCCSVLEHATEPWKAFWEFQRILAPHGKAIVSLPFLLHLHDEPYDYYRFTRYGAEYLARHAGLEVEEITTNGGFFHLMLNVPSVVLSIIWEALGLRSLIRPTNRFWLALASGLDTLFRLKEPFASNYIMILQKSADRDSS